MKKLQTGLVVGLFVFGIVRMANANLILLGQGTSTHGTYNLIYDTDLDITWYDYTNGSGPNGSPWEDQVDWAAALSVTFGSNVYTNWRLPITVDGPYVFGYDGTTTGGANITTSELGHLFYVELGNEGTLDTSGNPTGCDVPVPPCLTNTGDFQSLLSDSYYSGTEYTASTEIPSLPAAPGTPEDFSQTDLERYIQSADFRATPCFETLHQAVAACWGRRHRRA